MIRNWIIKKLGGVTQLEYEDKLAQYEAKRAQYERMVDHMTRVTVESCEKCSNLEALLAVSSWMRDTKIHGYQKKREILNHSGKKYEVEETELHDINTSLDGDFKVRLIER